jgi:lipopolysaccharide biosynthesis protein
MTITPLEPNCSRPPSSDWSVAVPFNYMPPPSSPRLGVVCHLFHIQVAAEILYYLRRLPLPADLFLSTDTADKEAELRGTLIGWDKGKLELRVVPNRGRDIAPKLVGFADVHDRYDLVLHLHSKLSNHVPFLAPWRSYLLETLLGSPEVVRSILDAFQRLPDLGMVAPQHFEAIRPWLGWNGNFAAASALARRMGMSLSPYRALDFPSGSMFWARPAALRPLLDLNLAFDDFPTENAQLDHTLAHAIERLFFYACEHSGHSWLKVAQPALMLDTRTVAAVDTPADLSRFVVEHGVVLSGPRPIETLGKPAPSMTKIAPGLAARLAARPATWAI